MMRAALQDFIYQTTHLSAAEPDGSHWCRIPAETLANGRAALAGKAAAGEKAGVTQAAEGSEPPPPSDTREALLLARLYVSGDAHKLMRWESVVTPDLAIETKLREALEAAYTFITQPRRMTRTEATYNVHNYNALTAKIRSALSAKE